MVRAAADRLASEYFADRPDTVAYFRTFEQRISFDLDHVQNYVEGGARILEVGAFPYLLTLPLLQTGFQVTTLGMTSTKDHVERIQDNVGFDLINCDLDVDTIMAPNGAFDVVVMNEVFEHLRVNLIFSMREIMRVLRPGGFLLLSTPNVRSIYGLYHLLWKEECYSSMGGIFNNFSFLERVGVMGHIREYTPKEVRDFLNEIGFDVQGTIYRGRLNDDWWLWRAGNSICRFAPQYRPFFSIVAQKPEASA